MDIFSMAFLVALIQIVAIDIVLGGDNAVVIGLACRKLPDHQRRLGILWGTAGAIGLRVVLIFFAVNLLSIPYLKTVGALLLFWIGIKLLLPEGGDEHHVEPGATLIAAVKTVIIADAVMSVDNVIAIAGAANGNMILTVFGLLLSVPIIVWGSTFVIRLMDRFPIVIDAGGALLGWIAGGMIATDPALTAYYTQYVGLPTWVASMVGAIIVVAVGKFLASRTTETAA